MLSALLYLRLTSFKNWWLVRARRLRQPKYLMGAIVGCAYFYFFFFRNLSGGRPRISHAAASRALEAAPLAIPAIDWLQVTTALGAVVLLFFITMIWVVPTQRAALGFTEAEIAFLFPAPVTRRALVHFRLLSSQFRSLLGGIILMLFSNRWSFLGGNAFTHAIGWWFIFSALNLHFGGANFTLTRLADRGLSTWRRRTYVLVVVLALIAITVVRLPGGSRLPGFDSDFDLQPLANWVVALTTTPPLGWLLLPFKFVLGPFLAVDLRQFLLALAPALGVLTLHYLWVVQTAVAFEDASVDFAQKRGARIAAWRAGERRIGTTPVKGRAAPFRLPGHGRPELAFFWKNLLSAWPYFTLRVLFGAVAVITIGCLWMNTHPIWRGVLPGVGMVALVFAIYALIIGPQFARQDIRSDLVHADVLKTYPLPGWQIILGELLTPVAILTGLLWLAVLTIALSFHPPQLSWLTPGLRFSAAFVLALITPVLVALQLLVPNAAALLFPAWFQTARTRGGGPEVVGQRMIFFFAQVLTMLIALLPPVIFGGALGAAVGWLVGAPQAVSLGGLVVLIVLVAEVCTGLWWLGQRFEKLDLSMELRGP